jgi:hypothetical protein
MARKLFKIQEKKNETENSKKEQPSLVNLKNSSSKKDFIINTLVDSIEIRKNPHLK